MVTGTETKIKGILKVVIIFNTIFLKGPGGLPLEDNHNNQPCYCA